MYNANRELRDNDPKREVYMAEARRKTTIEERKKMLNTVCLITEITRALPACMMSHTVKCIPG